jgi:hypothetical protein
VRFPQEFLLLQEWEFHLRRVEELYLPGLPYCDPCPLLPTSAD